MTAVRIWQQSISELDHLPHYRDALAKRAESVTQPSTTVEIQGMRSGSYPEGMAPIEALASPWNHYLANVQIVEAAVRAEAAGFDAMVVTCFHDPALLEARTLVSIPVVSLCESTLLAASTMGYRIGMVGIGPANVRLVRECVHRYGFDGRVVGVREVADAVNEHEIDAVLGSADKLVAAFRDEARKLIDLGAQVLVASESLLNTTMMENDVHDVDGVPVIDAYAAMLTHAEMLVGLQRAGGLGRRAPRHGDVRRASVSLRRAAVDAMSDAMRTAVS